MRVAVVVLGAQADAVEQILDAPLQVGAPGDPVQVQRVTDDLAHPLSRVQRGERVLEDHLHLTAHRTQLASRTPDEFLAEKRDRS